MKRILKGTLIGVLVLLLLLGGVFLFAYQNIEKIKRYALEEVNQYLITPIEASNIEVSVIKTFPNVSLALEGVTINDPIRKGKRLLAAKYLFLGFNIYDILKSNYKVQLVHLDSGSLNLYIDPKGKTNFDLLKPTSSYKESKKDAFYFQLNQVKLSKINLTYFDKESNLDIDYAIDETIAAGSFTEVLYDLSFQCRGIGKQVKVGEIELVKQKQLGLNLKLKVNNDKGSYELAHGELTLNSLLLQLFGSVILGKKENNYSLNFSGNKITIQDLLNIMPFKLPESIKNYASQGKVYFKGSYTGTSNHKSNPILALQFGIEEGSLTDPETKLRIEHINLNGKFDGGNSLVNSTLSVPNLTASLPGTTIKGDFIVSNFESPVLSANINGDANLSTLHKYFKWEDVKSIDGKINYTLSLKGSKTTDGWDWNEAQTSGIFRGEFKEIALTYLDKSFDNGSIEANLIGQDLNIKSLIFNLGKSDFSLNGNFPNFLKSLESNNEMLRGQVNVKSKELFTNDVLIYNNADPKEAGDENFFYQLSLNLETQSFHHNNFLASPFKCKAVLTPNKTQLNYFSLATCEGTMAGEGSFEKVDNEYVLKTNNQATHINITSLFTAFDNFGQKEITAKNLKGYLTARTEMMIYFDDKMEAKSKKILLITDMNIKQGELNNYEPLLGLSKFADVNDLKNLKFSELNNTLTIKQGVITIPEMDIKNNALNLSLSGKHDFNNLVDYSVKLALSDLIKKKRKVQPNEFGEEDPKTKSLIIHVRIQGPIDDLKYSFDKKGAKQQLAEEVKQEKQEIKDVLRQEFQVKKDTSLKKVEKKSDNDDELEFENE